MASPTWRLLPPGVSSPPWLPHVALHAALAAVLLALAAGCTTTRAINRTASPEGATSRAALNEAAAGRAAEVALVGGDTLRAEGLVLGADTTTWIEPASGRMRDLPTADIRSVRLFNRGRGAFEGAGLGLAVGVVSGAVLGALAYEEPGPDEPCFVACSRGGEASLGAVALGLIAAPIGLVAGLLRKSRTVYRVTASPADATAPGASSLVPATDRHAPPAGSTAEKN
jgi:hypothetical protein